MKLSERKFPTRGEGVYYVGITFHGGIVRGEMEFFMERKPEKFFSTESNEQHQNLKQTEMISYMRGSCPIFNTSLFTLKLYLLSQFFKNDS